MSTYIPVDWKEKHRKRGIEIKALRKRLKEVSEGRENWKSKYSLMKIERDMATAEIQQIKKKIMSII